MWILESDGDLFQHKKMWLKPGHQYLFGRTKVDSGSTDRSYAITHKTVSRKHLVINVSPLQPGQGSEVYTKSTITITDKSKLGTSLDGVKFTNGDKILVGNEHAITLGSYGQHFRLTWHPVVISFQMSDKQNRTAADALIPYRKRFEQFDIKTVQPYIISDTTHVVSSKRNTAKCLQALINGRYIITESFLDDLERAASSPGLADDGITPLPSKLEQDFDGNWPLAMKHLPASGKEPVPRPAELFAPNPNRLSMFEGYTFVFADQAQFDNLQPIVTNGGAKALKYDLRLGQTNLKDFVQYVRSVADKKGLGSFGHNNQGKGVVVVRFRGKQETEDWALEFIRGLDQDLEQRSVEQNEFLDAIVMADATNLRKPLLEEEEAEVVQAPPSTATTVRLFENQAFEHEKTAAHNTDTPASSEQPKPPMSATKIRARRQITQSRFKGFDDFDLSQVATGRPRVDNKSIAEEEEEDANEDEEEQSSYPPRKRSQHNTVMDVNSQSLFVTDSQPPSQKDNTTLSTIHKRRAPALDEADIVNAEAEMVDSFLPAAAAMKKRRLEDRAAGRLSPVREKSVHVVSDSELGNGSKKVQVKKEVDMRSAARSHAEALDKKRADQRKQLHDEDGEYDTIDAEEIAQLRNLVIIEEMDVPERREGVGGEQHGLRDEYEDISWDDRWNGRKNFKKFKKATRGQKCENSQDGVAIISNRARKVMVPLEEVRTKDYGIGDQYWLESTTLSQTIGRSNGKKRREGVETQPQSLSQSRHKHSDQSESTVVDETIIPEEIAGEPREGPVAEALRCINDETQGQSLPQLTTKPAGTTRGKRVAPPPNVKEVPPAKRPRQSRITAPAAKARDQELDSSDDELKFRFRRQR